MSLFQMMAGGPNPATSLFFARKCYWDAAMLVHLHIYCLWLLLYSKVELSSCNRDPMAHKTKNNILSGSSQKSLQTLP